MQLTEATSISAQGRAKEMLVHVVIGTYDIMLTHGTGQNICSVVMSILHAGYCRLPAEQRGTGGKKRHNQNLSGRKESGSQL